jgi:taurine dioxygenase
MTTEQIRVEPIAPTIGAEIYGVDLSRPLDEATFEQVHQALMDHLVVFFRDQDLSVDGHYELATRFGPPLQSKKLKLYGDRYDSMSLLENDGTKVAIGSVWHADNTDFEAPPMGALLYCEVAPRVGGDTIFANMYQAFETLAEPTKNYLRRLTALHDNSNVRRRYAGQGLLRSAGEQVDAAVEHPVVHRHPVTRREALFVNANYTTRIAGVSDIESQHVLQMLHEHIKRPEFQVRFRWRPKSLAIWDNRCTQHHALDDYGELRRMRRVQIGGSTPIPA